MTDPFYRSPTWRQLRAAALRRDGHRCTTPGCGAAATRVDHILSRRAGGADALSNLRSLCSTCDNAVKEDATGARRGGGKPVARGSYSDGSPRDPGHPWFTGPQRGAK